MLECFPKVREGVGGEGGKKGWREEKEGEKEEGRVGGNSTSQLIHCSP